MKQFKNQQGYALLVVLLMVVLFLGLSATFMAGSLSNAKQEQTVDASNQAVASAEMGVKYYSADFQREIGIIKSEIIVETQLRLMNIVDCFKSGDTSCDEQSEIKEMEEKIDEDMKVLYIEKIINKVADLENNKVTQTPFPGEDVHYAISGTSIIKQNADEKDISLVSTTDKVIKSLKIQLDLSGTSGATIKYLKGIFTIEVPDTFLSATESLTIETKTVTELELKYENMFPDEKPGISCTELLAGYTPGSTYSEKECYLDSVTDAGKFVEELIKKGLDPKNFTVFTEDFKDDVCRNNCNNVPSIEGLTIVLSKEDADSYVMGNMNKFTNVNFIVDGYIVLDNMNSLGKGSEIQTLIFKELTSKNVKGGGISNTNLLILGKDDANKDSRMEFTSNLTIGDNGRLCFDLDRILPSDVVTLGQIATFTNWNTTGQIIYFTSDLENNEFVLTDNSFQKDPERTEPYVIGFDKYTTFLSNCGIDVSGVTTDITKIPTSYIVDPIFDLDVEY